MRRYAAEADPAQARPMAVLAAVAIGLFFLAGIFAGLGAMVCGRLDPTDANLSLGLLARSFGDPALGVVAAMGVALTLQTSAEWLTAASGAVARGTAQRAVMVVTGLAAIVLAARLRPMNAAFLFSWALGMAASTYLPAVTIGWFWRGATRAGVAAGMAVGGIAAVVWLLLSREAFIHLYGLPGTHAVVPFNQPAIVTAPLAGVVLVGVSLVTRGGREAPLVK
jgi:cation/acetate symporter